MLLVRRGFYGMFVLWILLFWFVDGLGLLRVDAIEFGRIGIVSVVGGLVLAVRFGRCVGEWVLGGCVLILVGLAILIWCGFCFRLC